jgi:hypothetical protein
MGTPDKQLYIEKLIANNKEMQSKIIEEYCSLSVVEEY